MQIRWAAPTRMQSALFLPFPPLNYLLIHLKAFPTFCHHKNAFESLVSDAAQSTCVTSPLLEKSYRWILLSSSYAPVLTPSNRQTCTGHIIQIFAFAGGSSYFWAPCPHTCIGKKHWVYLPFFCMFCIMHVLHFEFCLLDRLLELLHSYLHRQHTPGAPPPCFF